MRKELGKYVVGVIKDNMTIISVGEGNRFERKIKFRCNCGNEREVTLEHFYKIKSCGCLARINAEKVNTIHGISSTKDPEKLKYYHRWKGMVRRCHNPNDKSYKDYGGRGIIVCDRWREPNGKGCENYYNDVHEILGPRPSSEHSLDRIDNDGNYEISNLRWATKVEQHKNRRKFKQLKLRRNYIVESGNRNYKLSQEQVEEIRTKYIPNVYGFKRLAKEYGVSDSTISYVIKNRSYD
jgi:hypothetical protein